MCAFTYDGLDDVEHDFTEVDYLKAERQSVDFLCANRRTVALSHETPGQANNIEHVLNQEANT